MTLRAQQLSVGYGHCAVVEGVNLTIQAGEIHCLLGQNGSGKSTLIKTLLGLIPPCGGTVDLHGRALHDMPPKAVAKKIAYVPQVHGHALGFTVTDMVLMGRAPHWNLFGKPKPEDHEAVQRALTQLNINMLAAREFNLLSGGQQQLVLIARALCQGADILLLDEPTANLDLANANRVMQALKALADTGKSVMFSTHNPQDALALNAQACLLKGRQVLAQGTALHTLNSSNLSQLYGLPVDVSTTPSGQLAVVPHMNI